MNVSEQSGVEVLSCAWKRFVAKKDCIIFMIAFVLAMAVHLYMFMHKFINHDDVEGMFSDCSFGLSSGRWLLHFITGINGSFSSSWLNGTAGAVFLALAVVFFVRIFSLRHYISIILAAAAMVAFPTVASTYAYMFCSYQYLFALAAALLGALLIRKERWYFMLLGSICIACSMGCYQAYLGVAAAVLLLSVIMDLCDQNRENAQQYILAGVKYVLFLGLALILYFIILKLCLWYTGTELVDYQGINQMGQMSLEVLRERLDNSYTYFFQFYKDTRVFHSVFPLVVKLSWWLEAAFLAYVIVSRRLYRKPVQLALLVALIPLIPIASNLVYIMTDADNVHLVMRYGMLIPLLIPTIVAERCSLPVEAQGGKRGKTKRCAVILLCVLLLGTEFAFSYEFTLITNRAYFSMDLTYENVYAYYTKLMAKIELQEGYTKDSEIAFIGNAAMDSHVPYIDMTGVLLGNSALNIYSRSQMFSYYFATDYYYASKQTCSEIQETEEFKAMPCYPDEGSIATINGVITVKFSS